MHDIINSNVREGEEFMDNWFAYVVNLVAAVFLIWLFYKIGKGIMNFFKGIAWDVKYTTERVKEKSERRANVPIIVEDIIKSIETYCDSLDLINSISIEFRSSVIYIYMKDGNNLSYNALEHGFDMQNYDLIAKTLANRLNFTLKPSLKESPVDQGYDICGYLLLSDYALKRAEEIEMGINNRIKV